MAGCGVAVLAALEQSRPAVPAPLERDRADRGSRLEPCVDSSTMRPGPAAAAAARLDRALGANRRGLLRPISRRPLVISRLRQHGRRRRARRPHHQRWRARDSSARGPRSHGRDRWRRTGCWCTKWCTSRCPRWAARTIGWRKGWPPMSKALRARNSAIATSPTSGRKTGIPCRMGLPRAGEGGMDQTPTWGRTYWGGALYCLQADVAIREQTANRVGLQTALRAILKETGGYRASNAISTRCCASATRPPARTCCRISTSKSRRRRRRPISSCCGRGSAFRRIRKPQPFDDHAPLAAIRIAITAPPSP